MKRALFVFSTILFLGISTQAQALLSGSRITSVTKIDDSTCAITLDANGSGLLDILSLDQLQLNDSLLVNLSVLVQRLLSLDLTQVHEVLVASPAFETLTGLTADVHLDNDDCAELEVGDVLKIAVPGLLGLSILDTVTLPGGFGDLTSILIDEEGNIDLIELVEEVLEIVGLDSAGEIGGGHGNIGTPPEDPTSDDGGVGGNNGSEGGDGVVGPLPGDAASGGCSLGAAAPAAGLELLTWVGAAAALFASRKRR
ncbi:MAG TPA: hypothetical protein VFW62_11095 [bacterium]|nr:hypothetical protein [bacterium]